jgi:hypothetical protein
MNNSSRHRNQGIVDKVPTVVLLDLLNHEFRALGRFIDSGLSYTQN